MKLIFIFLLVVCINVTGFTQGLHLNSSSNLFFTKGCDSAKTKKNKEKDYTSGSITSPILSLKIGYHTSDKEKEFDGFTHGLIFDVSAEAGLGKGWYTGIGFEYWASEDDNFHIGTYVLTRNYNAYSINLLIKRRGFISNVGIEYGIGIGQYKIKTTTTGGYDVNNFFNITAIGGVNFLLTKTIFLSGIFSYSRLTSYDRDNNIFSIKFGISYILK